MLIAVLLFINTALSSDCPKTDLGETMDDCPWAEITRSLKTAISEKEDLKKELKKKSPELFAQLVSDSKQKFIKGLWGKSQNYDEMMKAEIVDPEILDAIFGIMQTEPRDGRVVHAGAEHTYGYLFSNLKTSFGYKRARWVSADIENGLGFTRGTLGPKTNEGTLFLNVSVLAAKVAYQDYPLVLSEVKKISGVHNEVKKWSPSQMVRLIEKVKINENRMIEIRTDFVPFKNQQSIAKGANAELLIYSIYDSLEVQPKLITLFPVASGFKTSVLDPKNLGQNKDIKTRYNAFVDGMTNTPTSWSGTREVKE